MARKSIYLRPAEYNALKRLKLGYEQANGSRTDWGTFLLFLLGSVIGARLLDDWLTSDKNHVGGKDVE